jgi:hypothetical protein
MVCDFIFPYFFKTIRVIFQTVSEGLSLVTVKKGTPQFTVRSTDTSGNTGEDQFTLTVNLAEASKAKPR